MLEPKQRAKEIIKEYGSNKFAEILTREGQRINAVLPWDDFYDHRYRNKTMYVRGGLMLNDNRSAMAHMLGHYFLHREALELGFKRSEVLDRQRYEHEADVFAAHYLIPDDRLICLQGQSLFSIARIYGTDTTLVVRRFGRLSNVLCIACGMTSLSDPCGVGFGVPDEKDPEWLEDDGALRPD